MKLFKGQNEKIIEYEKGSNGLKAFRGFIGTEKRSKRKSE